MRLIRRGNVLNPPSFSRIADFQRWRLLAKARTVNSPACFLSISRGNGMEFGQTATVDVAEVT